MPRSGDEARRRLQQAAVELYRERGFDQTTTAEIAARAGVTERTFFRQFRDKREVLFDGQAALGAALVRAVAEAPDGLGPHRTLLGAFLSVETLLVDNRPFSEPRQHIITATPALRERELAKVAALAEVLAAALRERGTPGRQAVLAAQAGLAAFGQAFIDWIDDPEPGLGTLVRQAFEDLNDLFDPGM